MIISPSKEFIFIHLEKCGGTSIETALQPYLRWDDLILGSSNFGEELQGVYFKNFGVDRVKQEMLWKHSTAQEIYQFLGPDAWSQFKKISIVRKPEHLVTSLYNFSSTVAKYHMGRVNRAVWKERLRVGDLPPYFPFTEGYQIAYINSVIDDSGIDGFVENILKEKNMFCAPQYHRLTSLKKLNIDLLIDLSDLENRWNEILLMCNIEDEIKVDRLNISEKNDAQLSNRSIKKIKKHFAIDYQELPKYTGVYWN